MTVVGSGLNLEEVVPPSLEPLPADSAQSIAETELRVRALVREQFDFVWRLLRRLRVPASDVEDAAQQVFIVAARRLAAIAHGSERTFLYGTALHVAATLRRGLRRRQKWIDTRPADCASPSNTPHEALERRQAIDVLDELLAGLGHQLRVVFVLCELEELPAPEVAAMLGVPVGTVASRLRRAREKFRVELRRTRAKGLGSP